MGQWGGPRESAGCRGNGSRADCRGGEGIPVVRALFSLAHQHREVDQDQAETSEGEEGALGRGRGCPVLIQQEQEKTPSSATSWGN